MYFDQSEFDSRCEWGERGVAVLAPISDVVIVVDVLSFTTSVDVAVGRGAVLFPYRGPADQLADYAASVQAETADPKRAGGRYSLSPASLQHIEPGTRLVLPSLNGSTLSLGAGPTPVLAGCLRNAQAVALAAGRIGRKIALIPAGERWWDDYSLRPSFEDLIGAGALISCLNGTRSPEAATAAAAFEAVRSTLDESLEQCSSGKELIEKGFGEDVRLAGELNVSDCVPILREAAFVMVGFERV
jgi:2-phosphosulfolactate phosphatase